MKRSSVAGILACWALANFPLPVFAGLHWLYPLPQGNPLQDVEFLDESTAIAVGVGGTAMVSHDGGLTWTYSMLEIPAQPVPLGDPLHSVAGLNASTAIVVGGALHRTDNAAGTWTTDGMTAVRDVDFEGNLGFAVVSNGLNREIERSVDGGQTWSVVYSDPGIVRAVDIVSTTCIVGVGENFVRSVDGGNTWTTLPFDPATPTAIPFFDESISFVDELNGVVATGTDRLYVTDDGGVTWTERVLDPVYGGADILGLDVEMLDLNTLLVAASNKHQDTGAGTWVTEGQFLRSTDGGVTWQSEFAPRAFHSLTHNGSGDVLLVGDAGIICRWTDSDGLEQVAGSTQPATVAGGRSAFLDPDHGIVTASFMVLRTSDAGQTWSSTQLSNTNLTDVAMTTSGAYAVGSQVINGAAHNVLLKSPDGGQTWSPLWSAPLPSPSVELKAIAFGSATHGVALKRGAFVVIDNDIVTPATTSPSFAYRFEDVAMSGQVALASASDGSRGYIFRSGDGGLTWGEVPMPPGFYPDLHAVTFASSQICVAAGSKFIRSTDGGTTWTEAAAPSFPLPDIRGVAFSSEIHGVAVGEHGSWGSVFETMDGGQNWVATATEGRKFADVVCFEPFRAIITGPGLEILEYTNPGPTPTLISSFGARAERFAATLQWAVHDGSTPAHFEIHRRVDGATRAIANDLAANARSFRDESVVPGATYEYTLTAYDEDGSMTASAPVSVTIPRAALELLPNQPNPFNPATTIRFVVPVRDRVRLTVYDVAGRRVATLLDGVRDAGTHSVQWNGTDARGEPLASGVYLGRLESGKTTATRKMVLMK